MLRWLSRVLILCVALGAAGCSSDAEDDGEAPVEGEESLTLLQVSAQPQSLQFPLANQVQIDLTWTPNPSVRFVHVATRDAGAAEIAPQQFEVQGDAGQGSGTLGVTPATAGELTLEVWLGDGNGATSSRQALSFQVTQATLEIVSVTMSKTNLQPGESVTFTALARVVDEARSIQRGALFNQQGAELGTFIKGGDGAWSVTVSWEELVDNSLAGKAGEELEHHVEVRFYDDQLNSVAHPQTLSLGCMYDSQAICEGGCIAVRDEADHCGQCGFECRGLVSGPTTEPGEQVACVELTCGSGWVGSGERKSCSEICAAHTYQGRPLQCEALCGYQLGDVVFNPPSFGSQLPQAGRTFYEDGTSGEELTSCDTVPPETLGGDAYLGVRCCCTAAAP